MQTTANTAAPPLGVEHMACQARWQRQESGIQAHLLVKRSDEQHLGLTTRSSPGWLGRVGQREEKFLPKNDVCDHGVFAGSLPAEQLQRDPHPASRKARSELGAQRTWGFASAYTTRECIAGSPLLHISLSRDQQALGLNEYVLGCRFRQTRLQHASFGGLARNTCGCKHQLHLASLEQPSS